MMVTAGFDIGCNHYVRVTVLINTPVDVPPGCIVLSECQRGNLEVLQTNTLNARLDVVCDDDIICLAHHAHNANNRSQKY